MTTLPLTGITVVDFTEVYLGPSCTQLLGDFGADVIKIERITGGDRTRDSLPDPDGLDNPIFLSVNRSKRSLCIDIRSDDGRAAVHEIIKNADVVVSNFRAGVMERLGFAYEALRQLNPGIIWASATGFGTEGPHKHKGGQDVIAQAYSGLMARKPSADIPTHVNPTGLCDYMSGMHMVQGILLALLHKERTGEGQRVEIRMYDSALHPQMQEAAMLKARGREVNWGTMPLTGVFATTDGELCLVGGFHRDPLPALARVLGLPEDALVRPEFADYDAMMANRSQLQGILADGFKAHNTEHWLARLEDEDLLCAPVNTLATTLEDEQTAVNKMVVSAEHTKLGEVKLLAAPIHLSTTPATYEQAPPMLGEHTDTILEEAGLSADRIAELRGAGIIR
ncbi:formyl-CoA transferase [Georgenia soli]|uniref:Formyl-CoA transferase n=1 Tax=Georgenia soli TaxID=638953 RepID=A0A2A9F129_9MICO|nr:CaiB/BaiF CoA-transferase family protein [Georgenia soli]PFG45107.1 formyl-CoA transferase [Georgenia soli]